MKQITSIDITAFAPDAAPTEKPFSSLFIHLADGRVVLNYDTSLIDLNGLMELQKRILLGQTVYMTPALAAALGIEL